MKRLKAFLSGVCLLSAMFVLTSCNNANTENKSSSIEELESKTDTNESTKSDEDSKDEESEEDKENILQQAKRGFDAVVGDDVDPDCVYISSDGSYLKVDTNPNNIEDGSSNIAEVFSYALINTYLELPESLNELMSETRAIDGMQTRTYGNITVSWNYHPDKGLEAIYELTE